MKSRISIEISETVLREELDNYKRVAKMLAQIVDDYDLRINSAVRYALEEYEKLQRFQ